MAISLHTYHDWVVRLNSDPRPLSKEEEKIVKACPYFSLIRRESELENFTPNIILREVNYCNYDCICNSFDEQFNLQPHVPALKRVKTEHIQEDEPIRRTLERQFGCEPNYSNDNLQSWFTRLSDHSPLTQYEKDIVYSCTYLTQVRNHYEYHNFSLQGLMKMFTFCCDDTCICSNLPLYAK